VRALIALAALAACAPASAVTAYLQSCTTGSSVTGKYVFIGVYEYMGSQYTYTFLPSQTPTGTYCPPSVELQ
jgi:hypothetical protein